MPRETSPDVPCRRLSNFKRSGRNARRVSTGWTQPQMLRMRAPLGGSRRSACSATSEDPELLDGRLADPDHSAFFDREIDDNGAAAEAHLLLPGEKVVLSIRRLVADIAAPRARERNWRAERDAVGKHEAGGAAAARQRPRRCTVDTCDPTVLEHHLNRAV